MSEPELSPLAQKLAESHEVDLSALYGQNPEGKITARNVLEYLSLTSEEAALLERHRSRDTKLVKKGKGATALGPQNAMAVADPEKSGRPVEKTQAKVLQVKVPQAKVPQAKVPQAKVPQVKVEEPEPAPPSAAVRESQKALNQTRSQLQATAMVHQKALMQVGSLRQQNEALDVELERLKSKEEAARSFIQELEAKQRSLEHELEQAKKKPKPLEWLRRKIF